MNRIRLMVAFLLMALASAAAFGQQHGAEAPTTTRTQPTTTTTQPATRDATREKLRPVLEAAATKINVTFRQSDKQPYNFVGVLKTGLKNADSLEIVISVSAQD